jgi:hypothetical protein
MYLYHGGNKMVKTNICIIAGMLLLSSLLPVSAMINDPQPPGSNDHPITQPPTYDANHGSPSPVDMRGTTSDFGFPGVNFTGWTPPDTICAAGPNHVIVIVNGAIAFFEKDGTKDFQMKIEDSDGFWGEVGATHFVFDPEVIYDPHSNRFMAIAAERAPGSLSYFLLAVSDDSDPNGNWYKYRIDVTGLAGGDIDSDNIGVDGQAVYLSADFFTGGEKYLVYILEKEPLLSGTIGITRSMLITGSQSYGIPVIHGDAPAMYMIEHFENPTNTIVRLHAITDPLGTPQRVTYDLSVPAYSPPENPPQKGTSSRPETFDSRFWSCVWWNGSLWATHHQGTTRVMARWYEIKTNDWPVSGTPTLYQSGDIDPGPDVRTFFTAISPNGYGDAAMCFARSSPTEYISMSRCMRLSTDPLGTMREVVFVHNSTAGCTSGRWGDYSGVSCDPSDNRTFWMHGEYAPTADTWNTWISRCTGPNSPPNVPGKPSGPDQGITGVSYTFSASTTDPEGDPLSYQFNWGDGNISGWLGPYPSGATVDTTYSWRDPGAFEVRVKAKDAYGESPWSAAHPITIFEAPRIEIRNMTGGLLKISVPLKNTGAVDVTHVNWTITLAGGAWTGKHTTGTSIIRAGKEVIVSSRPILGFGATKVTVTAQVGQGPSVTRQQDGFVLLVFVHMKPGGLG